MIYGSDGEEDSGCGDKYCLGGHTPHLRLLYGLIIIIIIFKNILLAYITYTEGFHFDISIYAYDVSWLDSPLHPSPSFLLPTS
jgi:hypothetical protein